jgi:hypothetical protein
MDAMARGDWAAGAAAGAAAGVAASDDPQAVALPNAKPVTTQGVVSELIWMLLPGGWAMAIVAFEETAPDGALVAPAVGGLAAEAAVPDGGAEVVLLGVALAAAGVVGEELALVAAAGAVAAGGADAAAGARLENAVATSEEDR